MNGFDLSSILNCYKGTQPCSAIYLGLTKIWPVTPPHDYSQDYLTIVSTENNNVISWNSTDRLFHLTISVSTDNGSNWTSYSPNLTTIQIATLNAGDKLLIKGTNNAYYAYNSSYGAGYAYHYFSTTKEFELEGNIMSLLYGDNFQNKINLTVDYCLDGLFHDCAHLSRANHLSLPATGLTNYCYANLFIHCYNLIVGPELPATVMTESCYEYMFYGCGLMTAPQLPAQNLARHCYRFMFGYCLSLTSIELPALTYNSTSYGNGCYDNICMGCSSLNYVKCMVDNGDTNNTTNWLYGVSATGTFVKNINATNWGRGDNKIPTGWTVVSEIP